MYKLQKSMFKDVPPIGVIRLEDGAAIPFDPANVDFQQYQVWLSEGNVPLPPDEPTLP
jgi:hypothetical protein